MQVINHAVGVAVSPLPGWAPSLHSVYSQIPAHNLCSSPCGMPIVFTLTSHLKDNPMRVCCSFWQHSIWHESIQVLVMLSHVSLSRIYMDSCKFVWRQWASHFKLWYLKKDITRGSSCHRDGSLKSHLLYLSYLCVSPLQETSDRSKITRTYFAKWLIQKNV